ncbi:hypothetical protein [Pseudorhodoferax soli]|uniref:Uncharacterized protein n=1 Tax=Pseudorhodoferax soli TaxID=545864 RepID=A0A368X5W0_9BURK|nr:hypothetical protein [Pseudorhodoferax soli]RCW63205.1 hypothetical protein DES41_12029 [Pseudorhodoferax soli]
MKPENSPPHLEDAAFDLRARAEMALAYEPGEPPDRLFKSPAPLLNRTAVRKFFTATLLLARAARAGGKRVSRRRSTSEELRQIVGQEIPMWRATQETGIKAE